MISRNVVQATLGMIEVVAGVTQKYYPQKYLVGLVTFIQIFEGSSDRLVRH